MTNKKTTTKNEAFRSEDAERDFWADQDITKLVTAGELTPVSFPNLKPTSSSISIRIPDYLLMQLKEQGNKLNIPYQTLMKQYIAAGVEKK